MSRRVRFSLSCPESAGCSVFFEPEGAEIRVDNGGRLTVEISGGDAPAEMELAYTADGIVIWAWADAETRVWDRAGQRLDV